MRKLLVLGAGGYGRTVADVASQLGLYDEIAFLDDGMTGGGILGRCEAVYRFCDGTTQVYPAFGNSRTRLDWITRLEQEKIPVPSLIHPRAYVSPTAHLGAGTVVLPMAAVNTNAALGKGCIINIGALVDHDCILGDGVHVAPGAVVKAENRIPAEMKIESGIVINNREYPL